MLTKRKIDFREDFGPDPAIPVKFRRTADNGPEFLGWGDLNVLRLWKALDGQGAYHLNIGYVRLTEVLKGSRNTTLDVVVMIGRHLGMTGARVMELIDRSRRMRADVRGRVKLQLEKKEKREERRKVV